MENEACLKRLTNPNKIASIHIQYICNIHVNINIYIYIYTHGDSYRTPIPTSHHHVVLPREASSKAGLPVREPMLA